MKLKKTMLAALAGSAALLAAPAFADNGWHGGHERWAPAPHYCYHPYRGHYYVAPRVVYAPAPRVAYAPPVVYAPAPVYRPAPVYPAPVVEPGISIRLHFPL